MEETLTAKLEEIAHAQKEDLSKVVAKALEIGTSQLWKEVVLNQYLKHKISRQKAIQLVGEDLVNLADDQKKIALEDINWGLYKAYRH